MNRFNLEKYRLNIKIAFEAVLGNKVRTVLTALGIIFGVAAVIAMLAIGNGAKKEGSVLIKDCLHTTFL